MTSALGGGPGIPGAVQWVFWVLSLLLLVVIALAYIAKVHGSRPGKTEHIPIISFFIIGCTHT